MSEQYFDTILEPGKSTRTYWRDLWKFRGLFYFLSWRDILVRYKQTIIGIAWSVIRPLLTLIVFTLIFGNLAGLPSNGVPYALLVTAGLLPWQFFSNAFTEAGNSLIANSSMLGKVYFPRLIIPASSVIVSLVDFAISLVILAGLMLWFRFIPGIQIFFLPLFFLMAVLLTLGAGFLVSSLNVKYRDFRYIIPFIVQFGLYISPVGFSSSVVPEKYRMLYAMNPMVGVIDGFRWCITGGKPPDFGGSFMVSLVITLLLFLAGLFFFRRMEREFADVI
ncbi:MAG: ABC transporter permease [Bacteroidia bacterium]|nr:ABC transporter permease [Bacteroidia bacterium]